MQHDRDHDEENEKDDDRQGERAEQRLLAQRIEPFRIVADRPVLEKDAGDPAVADQPGERHGKRGQPEIGDPEAVVQARQRA